MWKCTVVLREVIRINKTTDNFKTVLEDLEKWLVKHSKDVGISREWLMGAYWVVKDLKKKYEIKD